MQTAYVRTMHGECMDMSLDKALKNFLSDDGYRITLHIGDGTQITLRKTGEDTGEDRKHLDSFLGVSSVVVVATIGPVIG